jgi:phage terminase large subunit-like protein
MGQATGTKSTDATRARGRPRKYTDPGDAKRIAHNNRNAKRRRKAEAQLLLDHKAKVAALEKIVADTWQPDLDDDLQQVADAGFPNTAAGFQYSRDVLSGKTLACRWVHLACARHERDLRNSHRKSCQFRFDLRASERAMWCIQLFREIKGPRSGQRLRLRMWQQFIVASLFGWVKKENGARRFRYGLVFVPRGNGKTTMAAPIGLYMLAIDGEGGAEVYAAAVTRQQSKLVFDAASFMAAREPAFRSRFGVEVGAHAITQLSTASAFRPLSRDATTLDGLNVYCAILDELAQHKTREVHDVLLTATGKRTQSLILGISTAGSNQAGVGFEQWRYAERLLEGAVQDDSYFAIIYTVDKADAWDDPKSWQKANPNWGVSVMPDVIEQIALRAQAVASQQVAFKQKHLNIWTNAEAPWMNMANWDRAGDPALKVEQFEGEEVIIGLDLATRVDLAGKVRLFRRNQDGVDHYYAFAQGYAPEAALDNGINTNYATWKEEGWVEVSPGEVNDLTRIERSVLDDHARFQIIDVCYDPWQAAMMATNLDNAGVSVIEIRPTVANFSGPMKELEALIRLGRFHHDGSPALAWCVSCVIVQEDMKGNIYPRRDRKDPAQRIDLLIALLMAFSRRMALDAADEGDPSIMVVG